MVYATVAAGTNWSSCNNRIGISDRVHRQYIAWMECMGLFWDAVERHGTDLRTIHPAVDTCICCGYYIGRLVAALDVQGRTPTLLLEVNIVNVFNIIGGSIYQWDIDRKLKINLPEEITADEVHFAHDDNMEALVLKIYTENNELLVDIPNIMLQSSKMIKVWLVNGNQTICGTRILVTPRAKPSDYVYTETKVLRYETLEKRIEALEKGGGAVNGVQLDPELKDNTKAAPAGLVGELKDDLVTNISPDFVIGKIDSSGKEAADTNYARSGYIYIDSAFNVHIDHDSNPEYRVYVFLYDIDKKYANENSGIAYEYAKQNFRGYIRVCVRNTDISNLTDTDIEALKSALHIDVNNANKSIEELYDKTLENKTEINSRIDYEVDTSKPYNLLCGVNFVLNAHVSTSDGTIVQDNDGNCVSDFIPIDPTMEYICKNTNVYDFSYDVETGTYHQTYNNSFIRYLFAFYDVKKEYIPLDGSNTTTSAKIPENARYIRVTLQNEKAIKTARLIYGNYESRPNMRQVESVLKPKKTYNYAPNTGYEDFKMVMFGDSITHGDLFIDDNGISYVDYASDYLGATIYNVGLGGTRMALPPDHNISGRFMMTFFNLCQCIVSNDWSVIDTYLSEHSEEASYIPHINRLKTIDWNTIHAIGIMYGANDYMSDTPIGTAYNTDYHNFDGACAYGLDLLLTKYPHLQVILFTPFYRQPTDGDVSTDTDNATNGAGISMKQYGESLKNVSDVIHCPVIDTYHCIGINKYNKALLMKDGTHPRTTLACKRMGRLFAEQIKQYVFPLI